MREVRSVDARLSPLVRLKPGQIISLIIYKGTSRLEAKWVYDYFEDKRKSKTPVRLNGTIFNIRIEKLDNKAASYTDTLDGIYVIKLKGVIL